MRITRANTQKTDAISSLWAALPPAAVEKATAKLGWVCLVAAASTVFIFVIEAFLQPEIRALRGTAGVRWIGLTMVLLSLGFLFLGRLGVLSKQALLNAGVLYQVTIAFGIALFENTLPMHDGPVRGVSNVAVWIWLCGTLVPNRPILSLAGALGSAGMWWTAHWASCQARGYAMLPAHRILAWLAPLVICSVWVFFLNRRTLLQQIRQHQAEELGAYQLEYPIGRGGMGEVWRASHRMLARDSAVKLIRADALIHHSGRHVQLMQKRFEREARVTASLKSPHTVALYDFGVTQDGSFYYVMELLNGLDLQSLVERFGPLPPARVVQLLRQVCLSLEEAHRAGLVHRDIKPRNIFLCSFGLQYDFAKVLDFGLVKSNGSVHEAGEYTTEGAVAGTPAYMAPEVAMGRNEVDGRADLYSLGCVAYYLLTGALVFDEPSPTAMALAHVRNPVIPPSLRGELEIPCELEEVVLACLAKRPVDRPSSAQELSRRLNRLTAVGTWSQEDAYAWWSLNLPEGPPEAPRTDEDATSTTLAVITA